LFYTAYTVSDRPVATDTSPQHHTHHLLDDLGIEHHRIGRNLPALIKKCYNALLRANHICRHAKAGMLMCHQRVKQILRDLNILFCRGFDFPARKIGS